MRRTRRFVERVAERGCRPTFATPGRVVARHPAFARELVAREVELAVHAYDHLDFRALNPETRRRQLTRGMRAFAAAGVPVTGFRCPYLGYDPTMRDCVPAGLRYSSNAAVLWSTPTLEGSHGEFVDEATVAALTRLYDAAPADAAPVVPRWVDGLLELPVSLPDDLQLIDGFGLSPQAAAQVWRDILAASREREELFVALMHPETADDTGDFFEQVLDEATRANGATWVAPLTAIADWWEERAAARVEVDGGALRVIASRRTTVLARGVVDGRSGYVPTGARSFERGDLLPFIGVEQDDDTATTLRNEGYVVVAGAGSADCATRLDRHLVASGTSAVLAHLDRLDTPVLRFARWPAGFRSAFALTGDLDALDLGDYASRVTVLGA